jgi:hypothetical protein
MFLSLPCPPRHLLNCANHSDPTSNQEPLACPDKRELLRIVRADHQVPHQATASSTTKLDPLFDIHFHVFTAI